MPYIVRNVIEGRLKVVKENPKGIHLKPLRDWTSRKGESERESCWR